MKFLLKKCWVRSWTKLKKQGLTLKKYSSSFVKFQKAVRNHVIENGNEKVWSYFILATLRWFTPLKRGGTLPTCDLCEVSAPNNLNHFLSCSGLRTEHNLCYSKLLSIFSDLGISVPTFLIPNDNLKMNVDILSNVPQN